MKKSSIQEVAEDEGFECRSYSGRGMYGKSCLGIDVSNISDLFRIGVAVGARGDDVDIVDDVKWDSMGRDYIVYFPDVEYCDDEDDDVEESE